MRVQPRFVPHLHARARHPGSAKSRHAPPGAAAVLLRRKQGRRAVVPRDRYHGGERPCVPGYAPQVRRPDPQTLFVLRPGRLCAEHQRPDRGVWPRQHLQDRHPTPFPRRHGVPDRRRSVARDADDAPPRRPVGGTRAQQVQPCVPRETHGGHARGHECAYHVLGRRATDHVLDGRPPMRVDLLLRGARGPRAHQRDPGDAVRAGPRAGGPLRGR
mmetsp:Transcript_75503/g.230940  ORF Transcript_75503/g.230940 Transcript_75503/m.230940 type:complete len:215 (+) Transcript_75503:239-883(+)